MEKYRITHSLEMGISKEYPIALEYTYSKTPWSKKDIWQNVANFRTEQEAREFYEKIKHLPIELKDEQQ